MRKSSIRVVSLSLGRAETLVGDGGTREKRPDESSCRCRMRGKREKKQCEEEEKREREMGEIKYEEGKSSIEQEGSEGLEGVRRRKEGRGKRRPEGRKAEETYPVPSPGLAEIVSGEERGVMTPSDCPASCRRI